MAVVLLWLLLSTLPALAQTGEVRGMVTAAEDGSPLVGVTVKVKGDDGRVGVTDADGRFAIKARRGETLVFSYLGYDNKEVRVGQKANLDVSLSEDSKMLGDVVVVGYGTMRRSDLTGATVSISDKEIKRTVVTSLDQALQGRAAGVEVTQNSGAPGGGISVNIRGINSLNGNEPLYVIDGIPIEGQTDGNSTALSGVNPSDIVSMEVLKDASATAIYGSRASNGVVLITTRQGEAGRTKVSYEGYLGLQQLPKHLELLNLREYAVYQNLRASIIGFDKRAELQDPSILGEGTDWQSEIFRTALMHNHQLNITGGSQRTRFAVMGGYQDQQGIALGSGFRRMSARANLDTEVSKWFTFGLNAYVSRWRQENSIDDADVIETALRQMPDTPARNPDGTFGTQQENMFGTYFSNPLQDAMMNENYDRKTDIQFNAHGELHLLKGLSLRIEYGGNINYSTHYKYVPVYDNGWFVQNSSGERSASNSSYTSFKTYLTYDRQLGRHHLNAMAGHEAQESKWEQLSGSRQGFLFNTVHELTAGDAETAKNSSARNSSAIESYYGRLNYGFDDRYLLTATLRADGSSTFGPNNRWGWFPSAALAWRAKNEKFLKDVSWLSNLKLRLGWGMVGNQWGGNYSYGSKLASSATVWGTGFSNQNYANPDLKWEQTSSYNAGMDLSLLNNRIELVVDAYYKKTDNLLMEASLPEYVRGTISAPYVNAGKMLNKGYEFTLNTVNIDRGGFYWRSTLVFSRNINKVLDLYTETAGLQGKIDGVQYSYTQKGYPAAMFYGYKVVGMFCEEDDFYLKDENGDYLYDANGNRRYVAIPENKTIAKDEVWYGDYIFADLNEDGVIDEKDRTYIGDPNPKFTYGFTNTLAYKDFELSVFLQGSYGNKVFNYLKQKHTDPITNQNMFKEATNIAVVEKIDPDGDETLSNMHVVNAGTASVQRITTADANTNNRMSDRFVEDGSYLRIKNISLAYNFTKRWKWMRSLGLESLRLYCNVQNLATFTKYSGYDPEVGAYNQGVLTRGIDYARYPSQRIFTFGLNINF